MFGRVDLIDADARIRLAMQASRALISALLEVVRSESLPGAAADARIRATAVLAVLSRVPRPAGGAMLAIGQDRADGARVVSRFSYGTNVSRRDR
jgi:hypothetical protein